MYESQHGAPEIISEQPTTLVPEATFIPEQASHGGPDPDDASRGEPPDERPTLAVRLDRVEEQLTAIVGQMAAARDRAVAQERIIDQLHADNQRLRAGETQLMLRPILVDLQRLRNELLAGTGERELSTGRVAELLDSFAYSVELTLNRGGVRVIRPEAGSRFDPGAHQAVAVVPAADAESDGLVDAALGDGYQDTATGRVVQPAPVRVCRWNGHPDAAPGGGDSVDRPT